MILRQILPPPGLADTVSHITVIRVDRLTVDWSIPLVAKAAPSVVFQSTMRKTELVLYGQNVLPFSFRASGHLLMIAFFLNPHRLRPLFGFRASEVTDRCIDLADWPVVRRGCLMERLAGAEDEERVRLMEGFITALCKTAAGENNLMAAHATRVILGCSGLASLRGLQEELRMTERSFQRLFDSEIGIAPKVYSRVCQFQPVFERISQGRFSRLIDIAYDHGYADQSHLIRAFREFTGFTPTEYMDRAEAFLTGS